MNESRLVCHSGVIKSNFMPLRLYARCFNGLINVIDGVCVCGCICLKEALRLEVLIHAGRNDYGRVGKSLTIVRQNRFFYACSPYLVKAIDHYFYDFYSFKCCLLWKFFNVFKFARVNDS